MLFWFLLLAAVAFTVAGFVRYFVPEKLDRWIVRQTGRWGYASFIVKGTLFLIGAILGMVTIVGAIWWAYPAFYGPALLLLHPMWERTTRRNLASFTAPVVDGLAIAKNTAYILGSLSTLIAIIRVTPFG